MQRSIGIVVMLLLLAILPCEPAAAQKAASKKPKAEPPAAAVAAGGATVAGFSIAGLVCMAFGALVGLMLWLMPIFIAALRGHPDTVAIGAVTFLFGWTFVGWGIALIWSLKNFRPLGPGINIVVGPTSQPPTAAPARIDSRIEDRTGRNPFDFS